MANYRAGVERYTRFWDREPELIQDLPEHVTFPAEIGAFGISTYVVYRSDKWDKGKFYDYIHEHENDKVRICCRRTAQTVYAPTPQWPKSIVFLGKLVEYQFTDLDGKEQTCRFGKRSSLDLCCFPNGRSLLVLDRKARGKDAIPVVWVGPTLDVTEAGIIG
jgi:hypothetical protein